MTAWSILTGNSTAPEGSTAWVHLNNQQGGGGAGTIIVDAYDVELEMLLEAQVESADYDIDIIEEVAVAITTNEIDVEID